MHQGPVPSVGTENTVFAPRMPFCPSSGAPCILSGIGQSILCPSYLADVGVDTSAFLTEMSRTNCHNHKICEIIRRRHNQCCSGKMSDCNEHLWEIDIKYKSFKEHHQIKLTFK